MAVSIRLDATLEAALEDYCNRHRVTKTALVTELVRARLNLPTAQPSGFALACRLGLVGMVDDDVATDSAWTHKEALKAKLRAKHVGLGPQHR